MTAAGAVRGNWCDVLDASNLHARACQRTQGALSTRAWSACAGTASRPQFDVKSADAQLLAARCHILCCKHGRVWGRLIAIGLDLHSACHSDDGLATRQVGHMDESVVEGSVDVGNAKHDLAFADLWPQLHLGLNRSLLLGRHC